MTIKQMAVGIYDLYPRKVGRRAALKAIENSIVRVYDGEAGTPMQWEKAVDWLMEKTKQFADSPAGNREHFTPHPATFFNKSRYLDDPDEWFRLNQDELRTLRNRNEANVGVWRPS